FENRWLRDLFAPLVIAGLVAMAVGSLSSTAYGGLGIFAAVFSLKWMRRGGYPGSPPRGGAKKGGGILAPAPGACFVGFSRSPRPVAPGFFSGCRLCFL